MLLNDIQPIVSKGEWVTYVHLNYLIDPTHFGLRLHQGSSSKVLGG